MTYHEQLGDRIRALVAGEPGLTEKKMFGGLATSPPPTQPPGAGVHNRLRTLRATR